jgi:hypothetical protein
MEDRKPMRRQLALALLLSAGSVSAQVVDMRSDPERLIAPLAILEPLNEAEPGLMDAEAKKKPKPKPDCLDGVKYDDGKFETACAPASSKTTS